MTEDTLNLTKKLSRSLEDYVRAIYVISKRKKVARVRDIANILKVKPPSVIYSLKKLSNIGLITYEKHGYIELTKKGLRVAKGLSGRFETIENFLINVLGVPKEVAETDACNLEHYLNEETVNRLKKFIEFLEDDPESQKIVEKFKKFYKENYHLSVSHRIF